jgi:demethylmenaquinone methyltransferase/2-methoxy-6-polyprenyl-1,4-benzoquinol methylase
MTTEPMFSAIAPRYDFCNHLFSFGLDFFWRKKTANLCCTKPIETALDMCCGTGDMAFALADTKQVKAITACDVSLLMLDLASRKYARRTGLENTSVNWLHKPAENTGLPDASFDLITCAFGLRNVDDVPQTLKEMYRLLQPGGRACILEFFLPQNKLLRSVYSFYLCRLMPLAARLIAGNPGPWHYLARSIEKWEKVNLPELLQTAGFHDITIRHLTFAAVDITIAAKK